MTTSSTPLEFLTEELAEQVVKHILKCTLYSEKMADRIKRKQGCIVIIVPKVNQEDPLGPITGKVLYTESVGQQSEWEYPFHKIALNKAYQLWQGRNDNGQTASNKHLLASEDTPFWGGVYRHGIVVAFSGENPLIDQMISGMVADMLKALASMDYENSPGAKESKSFIE